jgi:ATP-dependent DNA ligase
MRPLNGGPWPIASRRPLPGTWRYEPKYNGWRALVHIETGTMFNRKGERLSIEKEFADALAMLRPTLDAEDFKWADCEALERRHNIGRGALIVLDAVAPGYPYDERRRWLEAVLEPLEQTEFGNRFPLLSIPPKLSDPHAAWTQLQEINRRLGAEFYEGFVAKRADSHYTIQLRSPNAESTSWIKHRWAF